ncbi:MAG: fused MFS/spermidine synthase [Acidiferrobacterales bacterium]|nr:fused MFS/spermidine synthase [Acidiferrobacterales bacterium]
MNQIKQKQGQSNTFILVVVVLCFILSGFAALLYQTAWMRQFSLVFGTSELAVAAVLSAYMGGLALGASIAAKFTHRVTRPVLFYGLLEGGIAFAALAVPISLKLASLLYIGAFGNQPEPVDASGLGQSFFYFVMAFIVLAIPTTFMGATLPLLTKYVVQSKEQIGSRVGLLYATNTLGAIAGTVVAGFILLPILGLNGTVYVGVAINLLVFLLAAWIAKSIDHSALSNSEAKEAVAAQHDSSSAQRVSTTSVRYRLWILPIMLVSGANSFVYEVLWTRLLGHVLGGSITAFSTMLAGFLSGIAIGSAVASRFAKTRAQAISIFIAVQCGIAFTSMLIYQQLPSLLPEDGGLQGNIMLAMIILLPATIFIGATFPLAVRILALDKLDASSSSAKVYAWNTVGAIVGATVAAFFLIPILKYEGAIKLAVIVNIGLALATALLVKNSAKDESQPRFRPSYPWVLVSAIIGVAVFVWYQPKMPEDVLRSSSVYPLYTGDIRYYEVGRSATVVIIEDSGYLNVRTNGLPEASARLKGSAPYPHNQQMLSTMPVLARPDAETMLIVGLGGGIAVQGVPISIKEVDVIELEPQVLKANQSIGEIRSVDPLVDPRVNIIINDARSALTLTDKRYDAIVSQPSHPWTAGASHLYTREFMSLAHQHLSEEGVYLQWMNSQFIDEELLRSLCATMLDVFPYVSIYQWTQEVLFFLGSDQPFDTIEQDILNTGRPLSDDVMGYLEKGIGSVEDVVAALVMDQQNVEAFAGDAQIITDNDNIMATRSARAMDRKEALYGTRLSKLIAPFDPLVQEESYVRKNLTDRLNFTYIANRLQGLKMTQRAIDIADNLTDNGDPQSLVMIGVGQQNQGDRQESQKNLLLALSANPNNQQARYALLEPWFVDIKDKKELPEYVEKELSLLSGTALDTLNAWLAASDNDLIEVANLDAALASVLPSDLWYQTSVMLRTDWRIKVTTPSLQPRMANEAIRLIDSAIVFSATSELYSIRLKAALITEDVATIVETAAQLNYIASSQVEQVLDGYASMNISQKRVMSSYANQIASAIEYVEHKPEAAGKRLETLKSNHRWFVGLIQDI